MDFGVAGMKSVFFSIITCVHYLVVLLTDYSLQSITSGVVIQIEGTGPGIPRGNCRFECFWAVRGN